MDSKIIVNYAYPCYSTVIKLTPNKTGKVTTINNGSYILYNSPKQ